MEGVGICERASEAIFLDEAPAVATDRLVTKQHFYCSEHTKKKD